MRGAVLYGPRDIRFEDREMPKVVEPTDAVIRIAITCVCGSDLWPYRGLQPIEGPTPMGHEYCGIVEEVGSAVNSVKPGQFVIGSFATSDNTCPHCQYGYPSSCVQREFITRAQAPVLRVPQADGTLVPTPGMPSDDLLSSLLTTSDVLGTGWFAADAANVKPGSTVAVVGDGAVGLLGILSAKQMGAERIIAMSRHERFGRQVKAAGPLRSCRCGLSSIAHNSRITRRSASSSVRSPPTSRWLGYYTNLPSRPLSSGCARRSSSPEVCVRWRFRSRKRRSGGLTRSGPDPVARRPTPTPGRTQLKERYAIKTAAAPLNQ
jgi:hypothetical protein